MGQAFYNQQMHDYNIRYREAEDKHFIEELGYKNIYRVDTRIVYDFWSKYREDYPEPQGLCECHIPSLLDNQITKLKSYKFPSQGEEKEALIQDLKKFKTSSYFRPRLDTLIQLLEESQAVYTW